jgi:hypothetical protein
MIGFIKTIVKIKLIFLAIIVVAALLILAMKKCSYCRSLMKTEY